MNRKEYLRRERNKKIKRFLIDDGGFGYICLLIAVLVLTITNLT